MNRRQALKILGNSALVVGVGAALRYKVLPPGASDNLADVDSLAKHLYASLDADDRAGACVDYDHPFRQYHNRGVQGGGVSGWGLNYEQRRLLTDLFHAGLSQSGRSRAPDELLMKLPGVHSCDVLFCGDPHKPPYQLLLTGPHLNLRLGGVNREGVAFGGPQVYGDQRGDEEQGLPGNVYRSQFITAQKLFASLDAEQQKKALQETAPIQTQIELQGKNGAFVGVPLEQVSAEGRRIARELVCDILSTYPGVDVEYAWKCIEANGGIEALYASFYRDGEVNGSGQYQIFRLEGPAAVFYFRGYPHLHAFLNVAMNGDAPLSVGESLGQNARTMEGAQVKALFERAMLHQARTDLSFYDIDSVVGRLRTGIIRTGDIYNLESWQNRITVVEAKGKEVRDKLKLDVDPSRTYSLATTGYDARRFGTPLSRKDGPMLRDAVIDYVRQTGFSA